MARVWPRRSPAPAGFRRLSLQLIRIGEETGRLEEMLAEIADIYDQEVQRLLDRLLALMVPAITIGMGLLVALIIAVGDDRDDQHQRHGDLAACAHAASR